MVTPLQRSGDWTIELVGPKGYIHGWIKVGGQVEHKDSSKGRVTRYDPATQTAHVQWESGPRAAKNGGRGTTKAYHLKQGATKSREAQNQQIRDIVGRPARNEKEEKLREFLVHGGLRAPSNMTDSELMQEHQRSGMSSDARHALVLHELRKRNVDTKTGLRAPVPPRAEDAPKVGSPGVTTSKVSAELKKLGWQKAGLIKGRVTSSYERGVDVEKSRTDNAIHVTVHHGGTLSYRPAAYQRQIQQHQADEQKIIDHFQNSGFDVKRAPQGSFYTLEIRPKPAPEKEKPPPRVERTAPAKPSGTKRKHDWVKSGVPVQHKDGSTGVVQSYDPNTQTAHVTWFTGKRSGTTGTTKAYHTTHYRPGQVDVPKAPKAQPEKLAQKVSEGDLRKAGLTPLTGEESPGMLRDTLQEHYAARDAAVAQNDKRTVDLIDSHHVQSGVPLFDEQTHREQPTTFPRARIAAHAAELARANPKHPQGNQPLFVIRKDKELAATVNHNESTRKNGVAAVYRPRHHEIGIAADTATEFEESGATRERGHFSPTGRASFLKRTVTHEYAHSLDQNMVITKRTKMISAISRQIPGATSYSPQGWVTDQDHAKWVKANQAPIINHVSTYGSMTDKELIAELYTEGKLSPQPSAAAQTVVAHLEGRA